MKQLKEALITKSNLDKAKPFTDKYYIILPYSKAAVERIRRLKGRYSFDEVRTPSGNYLFIVDKYEAEKLDTDIFIPEELDYILYVTKDYIKREKLIEILSKQKLYNNPYLKYIGAGAITYI